MSIITCIAIIVVAGLIGLVKALNTKKNDINTQVREGNKELLMKNIETDNDDGNAEMEKNPETWTDEYGVIFSADKKKLIKAPKELKEYIIPEGTVSIEARAFKSSQIESVLIPNSVTRMKFGAFAWCYKLVVEIPDSVLKIDNEAFLFVKEVHCYGPLKEKGPWRAKDFITERPKKKEMSVLPEKGIIIESTPSYDICYEDGTYYKLSMGGKEVIHDLPPDGTGYGTSYDSEGKLYTREWVNGHTKEEFEELWREIN